MKALTKTDFQFPGQRNVYHGKVRDVYTVDDKLVMVATDRISAFDVILPKGIPCKGQILNQIASKFLDATADICPNWKLATPDPMVTVGICCEGFPVEMIVRGYLCGSAWRSYKNGAREICGVKLPEGMNSRKLLRQAQKRGLTFMPGYVFFPRKGMGSRYFRLNFSYPTEEEIDRGMDLLEESIRVL